MENPKLINIEDFNYELSPEKIAYYPVPIRDESKLLVYKNHQISDDYFKNVANYLSDDNALFFNNSRVIHARILVHNKNGAAIEIFCLEPLAPTSEIYEAFHQTEMVAWKCFVGNAKRWKEPLDFMVMIDNQEVVITAEKGESSDGTFVVTFSWDNNSVCFADWLEAYGKIPLPPYIKRTLNADDENRYQTIYACNNGSVAAPTAGLHFTDNVFHSLKEKNIDTEWITLHVGAGTFKPVSSQFLGEHVMHQEQIVLSYEQIDSIIQHLHKNIIAVGTTVVRTLESLFIIGAKLKLKRSNPFTVKQWEVYEDELINTVTAADSLTEILLYMRQQKIDILIAATSLLIVPGYHHKIARGLITNFHQPKSTLLLLIASYLHDDWKNIYAHALENQYRFLSYGDSNLYLP